MQRIAQIDRAVHRGAVDQLARTRRSSCRRKRSLARHAPIASKFSSAKPSGSITPWQALQDGFARCCSMISRTVSRLLALLVLLERLPRSAAAARAACPADVLQNPGAAQDRRRAIGVGRHHQHAALAEQAAASFGSVKRHAAELIAAHVRNAVVQRQPLVDERVVRPSAGRARCGPRGTMLSTNSSISRRNALRRSSSKAGIHVRVGLERRHVAHVQPLEREVGRPANPWPAGPPACAAPVLSSTVRSGAAAPAAARSSSSSSGMLLHRKNDSRDASSQIADAIARAGRHGGPESLRRGRETWARQSRRQRHADSPVSKSPVFRAVAIERQRRRQVAARHRDAERRAAQGVERICVAHGSSSAAAVGRPAHENIRRRLGVSPTPAGVERAGR